MEVAAKAKSPLNGGLRVAPVYCRLVSQGSG